MGDIADMYDPFIERDYDAEEDDHAVTCRHCGAKNLWWFPERRGRYLLKNPDGSQHNCRVAPASLEDFEDLTK